MFEVARWQAEQMFEDLQAQHSVDAVAGVQDQELAHPGHRRGEDHEHGEADADDRERIQRVVDDNLVKDHLGE